MGLILMREQALLEPSSRRFPGAQRARTRVLGRGCNIETHKRPSLPPVLYPVLHPKVPLFLHPRKALGNPRVMLARRANRAGTYRFCRWGSTGPARTRGPRTRYADTRTPRTAPPRWPRSGTARTATPATQATVRGSVSILGWNLTHFPSPWGQGLRLGRLPWAWVHRPDGDPKVALSLPAPHRGASVFLLTHTVSFFTSFLLKKDFCFSKNYTARCAGFLPTQASCRCCIALPRASRPSGPTLSISAQRRQQSRTGRGGVREGGT